MLKKKLVSICVFSYNQEKYIKDTINAVLKQTYSPLDIIISDDCSTDKTFKIILDIVKKYEGPHNIITNRNSENLGVTSHVNLIFQKFLRTDILVVNAGDDISHPERVSLTKSYFDKNEDVYAVCSNARVIDSDNNFLGYNFKSDTNFDLEPRNFSDAWSKGTQFFGAAAAYRKDVFSIFGSLNEKIVTHEDFILPFRASLIGKIGYIKKTLIDYRKHDNNLSYWVKFTNAKSLDEFKKLKIHEWNNKITNLEHLKNDIHIVNNQEALNKIEEIDKEIQQKELRIRQIDSKLKNRMMLFFKHLRIVDRSSLLITYSPNTYLAQLLKIVKRRH